MDVSQPSLIWINRPCFVTVGESRAEKWTRRSHHSLFFHLTLTSSGSALPLLQQPCTLSWVSMAIRRRRAEMAGGGLQMAGRNMSSITYLAVYVDYLCDFLLIVEELHNCASQSFDWLVRKSPWQQCQGAQSEVSTCTSIGRQRSRTDFWVIEGQTRPGDTSLLFVAVV